MLACVAAAGSSASTSCSSACSSACTSDHGMEGTISRDTTNRQSGGRPCRSPQGQHCQCAEAHLHDLLGLQISVGSLLACRLGALHGGGWTGRVRGRKCGFCPQAGGQGSVCCLSQLSLPAKEGGASRQFKRGCSPKHRPPAGRPAPPAWLRHPAAATWPPSAAGRRRSGPALDAVEERPAHLGQLLQRDSSASVGALDLHQTGNKVARGWRFEPVAGRAFQLK